MFVRIFALFALALIASAGQCNTGGVYCCNSVEDVQQAHDVLSKFNLVEAAAQIGGSVGLNCGGVTVIGTGSGCKAQQQPVCCEDNRYNGLVNIGCSPININA
ncbi:hydrophobin [Chiua virens]|nr:hydrophobin [Chiua virens]